MGSSKVFLKILQDTLQGCDMQYFSEFTTVFKFKTNRICKHSVRLEQKVVTLISEKDLERSNHSVTDAFLKKELSCTCQGCSADVGLCNAEPPNLFFVQIEEKKQGKSAKIDQKLSFCSLKYSCEAVVYVTETRNKKVVS